MLRALIVDDDADKRQSVRRVIAEVWKDEPGFNADAIQERACVTEGVNALGRDAYQLLVLDLRVPIQPNGRPDDQGGEQLLHFMLSGGAAACAWYTLGLTAFDGLRQRFERVFSANVCQVANYSRKNRKWEELLRTHASRALTVERARRDPKFGCEVAFVCALDDPELQALLRVDLPWTEVDAIGAQGGVRRARWDCEGRELRCIAAAIGRMGNAAAAAFTMRLIADYRPRSVILFGVTAGFEGKAGDIIVADNIWNYDAGKLVETARGLEFSPAPHPLAVEDRLTRQARALGGNVDVMRAIRGRWTQDGFPRELNVVVAPVASGPIVVAAESVMAWVQQWNRKFDGLEMEGYGMMIACHLASGVQPSGMVIKSVQDRGGADKANQTDKDLYRAFASRMSAEFVVEFAKRVLSRESPEGGAIGR